MAAWLHPPRGAAGPETSMSCLSFAVNLNLYRSDTSFTGVFSLPQSKATEKSGMHVFPVLHFCPGSFWNSPHDNLEHNRRSEARPSKQKCHFCAQGLVCGADKGQANLVFLARSQLSVVCGIEIENTRISRQPPCDLTGLGLCATECVFRFALFCFS